MVRASEQPAEGASRALWSSTAAFTVCFAVWTIFSIIGLGIKDQLGLSETEFGLLVGTPILTGSLTRVVLGVWADQIGGRRVFAAVMVLAAIATFLTSFADTYAELLIAALGVGIAGGSFSVGVTYVSKFYPKERQGTALGIFGAGNVGAAVTKFLAPFVMVAMGWQAVAQVWAAGLIVTAVVFLLFTREDPEQLERRKSGRKGAEDEEVVEREAPHLEVLEHRELAKAYGSSIELTGSAGAALWGFLLFYLSCAALTWFAYSGPRGVLHALERKPATHSASTVPA